MIRLIIILYGMVTLLYIFVLWLYFSYHHQKEVE